MRKFIINVNGNSYEVEVDEVTEKGQSTSTPVSRPQAQVKREAPVAKPKTPPAPKKETEETVVSSGQEVIDAPMPGNIWKVLVAEGDEVKSGDTLIILEAMKMENELVAPKDGKVTKIMTTEGTSVNTGDKLLIVE